MLSVMGSHPHLYSSLTALKTYLQRLPEGVITPDYLAELYGLTGNYLDSHADDITCAFTPRPITGEMRQRIKRASQYFFSCSRVFAATAADQLIDDKCAEVLRSLAVSDNAQLIESVLNHFAQSLWDVRFSEEALNDVFCSTMMQSLGKGLLFNYYYAFEQNESLMLDAIFASLQSLPRKYLTKTHMHLLFGELAQAFIGRANQANTRSLVYTYNCAAYSFFEVAVQFVENGHVAEEFRQFNEENDHLCRLDNDNIADVYVTCMLSKYDGEKLKRDAKAELLKSVNGIIRNICDGLDTFSRAERNICFHAILRHLQQSYMSSVYVGLGLPKSTKEHCEGEFTEAMLKITRYDCADWLYDNRGFFIASLNANFANFVNQLAPRKRAMLYGFTQQFQLCLAEQPTDEVKPSQQHNLPHVRFMKVLFASATFREGCFLSDEYHKNEARKYVKNPENYQAIDLIIEYRTFLQGMILNYRAYERRRLAGEHARLARATITSDTLGTPDRVTHSSLAGSKRRASAQDDIHSTAVGTVKRPATTTENLVDDADVASILLAMKN